MFRTDLKPTLNTIIRGRAARRLLILLGALICLVALATQSALLSPRPAGTNTQVAEERGALALGQALRRLGVVASVLHTGAHPDDEDSGLLAYLARGRQARTAYLSLTRGDGGQNVIGPELYEQLGVIRTEELLAARRLDGATQFFSRAFDFGFSKSRTETLSKWDPEEVLSDMVRVIRTFRPLVIVSAWSGTPNDGHGHHQAAGFLTREAYVAAADPNRFPEQMKEGLRPWQAKKLYLRSFDGAASPREFLPSMSTLSINTGEFDPLLGKSYYEIAARGRSQHRSQDEGTIEVRGPRYSRLRLIDSKIGPIGPEKDIFEGIDISIKGIASYSGRFAGEMESQLSEVQAAADEAARKYNPLAPGAIAPIISQGLHRIRQIRENLHAFGTMKDRRPSTNGRAPTEAEEAETDALLAQKESDFADALAKSVGIVVDCLTGDELVTPGQTFAVTVSSYSDAVCEYRGASLSTPPGWTVVQSKQQSAITNGRVVSETEFKVTVPRDAETTGPYWLRKPRRGDMFVIQREAGVESGSSMTGIEAIAPPLVSAKVEYRAGGEGFETVQSAQYRYADRSIGEIRRDLKVVPAVSVGIAPDILVFPVSNAAQQREVVVSVVNNAKGGSRGSIALEKPTGWEVEPASAPFELRREGERAAVTFKVSVPSAPRESREVLNAVASVGETHYQRGYQVLDYPHIERRFFYRDATTEAEVIHVKVASPLKVGYIEGAGDDFAAALKRIDVDVKTIDSKELASGDLSVYDAIVSGIRAYEVRPDLVANNARLMDYVNRGGTYITQYNRGNFEVGGYGPYPFATQIESRRGGPRLLYVAEGDLAEALAGRAGKSPRVGVISAPDDRAFKEIRKANIEAKLLDNSELSGELTQYDVIVIGSNIDGAPEALRRHNRELLDYARRRLIILAYSQKQFLNGNFQTYPKPEARPFRTTDETAKITVLQPNHPRFNYPNKITERDFEGWVQERGAYFLSEWDSHYKPLMSCHDPGEPDLEGGEVIAEYGKGLYVYTAYAWFRELPKGVPGAYRLIANLVSLPKSSAASSTAR
jgi:LmbE family N-acetylglucosaminyl deacetylase